jgi:cation transport regulator ChaC
MPDVDSEVWGVAYLCNPTAMEELDRFEGVAGGHYHRENVEVVTDAGEKLSAVAYVAGPRPLSEVGRPTKEYLELILKGAAYHRLPADYIRKIEQLAADAPSPKKKSARPRRK